MKILELLQKAKELYFENRGKCGMCWCIKVIANENKSKNEQSVKGHVPYNAIVAQIPEFTPEFFGATPRRKWVKGFNVGLEFWWDINDSKSRIEAFNKLIKLYERTDTEFVW